MVRPPLTRVEHARGERLGTLLREARGTRSMAEIAAASGVPAETLRKIETGRIATPAFFTVAALAACPRPVAGRHRAPVQPAGRDAARAGTCRSPPLSSRGPGPVLPGVRLGFVPSRPSVSPVYCNSQQDWDNGVLVLATSSGRRKAGGTASDEDCEPGINIFDRADGQPVRLLHTADCHLGNFMLDGDKEKEAFAALIEAAIAIGPDVLVVAGDLFDHGRVSDDVIAWTLEQMSRLDCPVIVLPGNHDYDVLMRIATGAHLAGHPGITIITAPDGELIHLPEAASPCGAGRWKITPPITGPCSASRTGRTTGGAWPWGTASSSTP